MRRKAKSYPLRTPECIQTTLIVHMDYTEWQGRESRSSLMTSPYFMEATSKYAANICMICFVLVCFYDDYALIKSFIKFIIIHANNFWKEDFKWN